MEADNIVLTHPDEISAQWLTDRLRQAGTLPSGHVVELSHTMADPFGALVLHLWPLYSADAPTGAPQRLFLKMADPDMHNDAVPRGRAEIVFYRALPPQHTLPVPRCYDAQYDEASGRFQILMDDLSESHDLLERGLPPTLPQCEALMDVLARVHVYWWGHALLGAGLGRALTPQMLEEWRSSDAENTARFHAFLGDRISETRRAYFERVLAARPRLDTELAAGPLTLCHGDAHPWNFLYPRDPAALPVLLDWEALRVGRCTDDLAYMMDLFWYPERRARYEQPLLRHYHGRLLAHGLHDYPWDDCWRDYRISITRQLFEPAWWWSVGMPAELWWPRLERILLAFEDLRCEELLH